MDRRTHLGIATAHQTQSIMPTLRYSELESKTKLSRYVLCYWEFEASERQAPFTHHVMPDGCVVLAYSRSRSRQSLTLVGPSLNGLQIPVCPGDVVWGVRFWPDAAGALLPLEPPVLRGVHASLTEWLPELSEELCAGLALCATAYEAAVIFDETLERRLPLVRPLDAVVRAAVRAITEAQGQLVIHDLAQHIGLSERQFQRRFRKATGLTPKQFARIRRLRSSVAKAMDQEPKGWSRVAADQGYADQAHLIREFSQLVGQSPTTYLERTGAIDHVNVTP